MILPNEAPPLQVLPDLMFTSAEEGPPNEIPLFEVLLRSPNQMTSLPNEVLAGEVLRASEVLPCAVQPKRARPLQGTTP